MLYGSRSVVDVAVAKPSALAVSREKGDISRNVNFPIKGVAARSFLSNHDPLHHITRPTTLGWPFAL